MIRLFFVYSITWLTRIAWLSSFALVWQWRRTSCCCRCRCCFCCHYCCCCRCCFCCRYCCCCGCCCHWRLSAFDYLNTIMRKIADLSIQKSIFTRLVYLLLFLHSINLILCVRLSKIYVYKQRVALETRARARACSKPIYKMQINRKAPVIVYFICLEFFFATPPRALLLGWHIDQRYHVANVET